MDADDLVTEPLRIHERIVDSEGFCVPPDLHAAAIPGLIAPGSSGHVVDDEAHSWVGQHVAVSLGRGRRGPPRSIVSSGFNRNPSGRTCGVPSGPTVASRPSICPAR